MSQFDEDLWGEPLWGGAVESVGAVGTFCVRLGPVAVPSVKLTCEGNPACALRAV